jgi:hypothetical protein
MIQDKIFFDEKDPTGLSYNTPFTVYGSYQGRLWSKTPNGSIEYYAQNSDLPVYATTGSNQFKSSQAITGSLTVTGQVIAQTLNVQQVTSSIVYSSGSNRFGNNLSNRQQFTGSLQVSGSSHRIFGNVGVGVTSPASELQVGKSSDVTIAMSNSSSVTSGARGSLAWYNSSVSSVATIRAAAVTDNVGTELQFFTRPAAGSLTQVLTLSSTGAATFNLGSGEMRLNRTGTSEYLKLNTYYLLTDGNDQLLGSVTGATSIYAGNGVSPRLTITSGGSVSINSGITNYHQLSIKSNGVLTYQGLGVYSSSNDRFISMNHTGTEGFIETENAGSGVMTPLSFKTGGSSRMTITSGGGMSYLGPYISMDGSGAGSFASPPSGLGYGLFPHSGVGLGISSVVGMSFWTGGTPVERMRITSGGNVGIGTDPGSTAKLRVEGTIYSNVRSNTIDTDDGVSNNFQGYGGYWALRTDTNNNFNLDVYGNGTPKNSLSISQVSGAATFKGSLTVDQGITVSSNAFGNYFGKFGAASTSLLELREFTGDQTGTTLILRSSRPTSGNFYAHIQAFADSSTQVFRVLASGTVENATGSYGSISDIKLKENIVDATPKLKDLLKVKIRNYNLIGDETKQLGVIAQELEEIFPGLVSESEDFEEVEITDEEGNVTKEKQSLGTTTKSVKYSIFVPMLIKAMQEQQTQIESLKSENDNLKSILQRNNIS